MSKLSIKQARTEFERRLGEIQIPAGWTWKIEESTCADCKHQLLIACVENGAIGSSISGVLAHICEDGLYDVDEDWENFKELIPVYLIGIQKVPHGSHGIVEIVSRRKVTMSLGELLAMLRSRFGGMDGESTPIQ